MADLHPTPSRLGLLADVADHIVTTDQDVIWLDPSPPGGFTRTRVTARIRELETAGWVEDRGDRWVLTDRGQELLVAEIVCTGRLVDDQLRPTGQPCGQKLRSHAGALGQAAIAAGWGLAPDGSATCPRCRRPPAEVAVLVREREVTRRGR